MAITGGFAGDIANPIIQARTEMSMSANALAKRLGLSRQYISKAEQGIYTNLNPALIKWIGNALSWSKGSVERRYIDYQRATREMTVETFEPHLLKPNGNEPSGVTFERWRSGYWTSPMQFAIAFCVHPDNVGKYEDGIYKKMPETIRKALEQVNLIDPAWETEATRAPLSA